MNPNSTDATIAGIEARPVLCVLLVEDDEEYIDLVREHLTQGSSAELRLIVKKNLQEGIAFAQNNPTDAVLLDLFLPDSRGLESVTSFRSSVPNLPIIALTSLNDEATALEAIRQGAQDYLLKDKVNRALLTRVVRYAIERTQVTRSLEEAHRKLGNFNGELERLVLERTTELQASLQEKEVLLKEIHHRVKNNLQVISSLLRLQSETVRGKEMTALFLDSQKRVQAMAMVHEHLYRSRSLARINFSEYVASLLQSLYRTSDFNARENSSKIEIDDVYLNVDVAVPCGLLLTELISNAMKYAYPDKKGGPIDVRFRKAPEGNFEMTVADHGGGFPDKFDWTKSDSLGLRLVRLLTEQLEGQIRVESHDGLKFVVSFKDKSF